MDSITEQLSKFEEVININIDNPASDINQQLSMYSEISNIALNLTYKKDQLKDGLSLFSAQRSSELRETLDRVTEAKLKEALAQDIQYQKIYREYSMAKHHADKASILKDIWHQRGVMLRNLINLKN